MIQAQSIKNGEFKINVSKRNTYSTMPRSHYHDYYEIYYLVAGERYVYIEDNRYFLKEGSLLFINKYDIHKTIDSSKPDHERIVIYFTDEFLSGMDEEDRELLLFPFLRTHKQLDFSYQEQNAFEQLLFYMMKEYKDESLVGREAYFRSLLVQLLLTAVRKFRESLASETKPMHAKMAEIVTYCNQHFREPLQMAQVANQFYISPYYFSRLFKKTTGFTFTEYVHTLRIREAQKIIRETRQKMIKISEHVGYTNISHFNRKFKQVTRMSPTEYKRISVEAKANRVY